MRKTILSTADVARLFNITETTVKRWADEGVLRCQKTPGGHRKFEMRHVIEFSISQNFEPVGALELEENDADARQIQMAVLNRDFEALARAFVRKSLSPDPNLYSLLSYLYEHHVQLWEMYDLVLSPGLREIGEQWARGEIGVSKEHRASYETLDALAKLQAEILLRPPVNYSVVCACPDEEMHEIGLRCAAGIFASEGWTVRYLGARTPYDDIIATIDEVHPTTVCLSSTFPADVDTLKEHLRSVYTRARSLGSTVILRAGEAVLENSRGTISDLMLHSTKEVLEYIQDTRAKATKNGLDRLSENPVEGIR